MVDLLGRYSNLELPVSVEKLSNDHTSRVGSRADRRATPSGIQTARPRGSRLSDADVAAICEAYAAGRSTYDLATEWSIWRGTVSALLKRSGVSTGRRARSA